MTWFVAAAAFAAAIIAGYALVEVARAFRGLDEGGRHE